MAYRATPLESGLNPAELLIGRKIRPESLQKPSQNSFLESAFGYQTKMLKGLWWTKLVLHAFTQLKLPRDN